MKNRFIYLALLPLLLAGCGPTRIVTYNPVPVDTHYTTTISPYRTHSTTSITQVYSKNEDISLQLDLQAVGALFAQANTVEEFEIMLNNGQYPVSNLDLNGDGYIDYLRVLETVNGYNHLFIIQAVLEENVFQDVATLVAEVHSAYNYYFEIIGAPYIYGPNFIVRPRFYARPPIFEWVRIHIHDPWHSPWHWGHFPPHYHHPRPIILNHYQAYVKIYMGGHPYCHEVYYPAEPRFREYDRYTRDMQRNDYGYLHPERSFTTRNANTPNVGSQGNVKNANDIRLNNEATKTTRTTDNRSTTSVSTGRGTGASAGTSGSTRSAGTVSGSSTRSTTGAASGSSTRSTTGANTTTRSSSATSGGSTRSAGSTYGSQTRSGSTTNASRSSSSNTSGYSSQSVTRSRVNSSGASTTTTTPATRSSYSSGTTRSSSSSGGNTRSSSSSSSTRSNNSSGSSSSSSNTNTSKTRGTRR